MIMSQYKKTLILLLNTSLLLLSNTASACNNNPIDLSNYGKCATLDYNPTISLGVYSPVKGIFLGSESRVFNNEYDACSAGAVDYIRIEQPKEKIIIPQQKGNK